MTSWRVAADPATAGRIRPVLASVPAHFVVVDDDRADVTVVSGRDADWPARVARAVDEGARGVVVTTPGAADVGTVRHLADRVAGRAVVAVDTPYATDPAWTEALPSIAADARTAALIDSVVTVPAGVPLAEAFTDQLAVLRPLLGEQRTVTVLRRGAGQYVAAAHAGASRATISGVTSAAGIASLTIDVVSPGRRWAVRFDDTALARPTEIIAHDADGSHARPLRFESGHRVTWTRLHRALSGGGTPAYSLADLAADLSGVRAAVR